MSSRSRGTSSAGWEGLLRGLVTLAFLLLAGLPAARPAPAAEPAAPAAAPDKVSVEELERLVETLESEPDRAKLVEQLKALIAAQRAQAQKEEPVGLGAALLEAVSNTVEEAGDEMMRIVALLTDWGRIGDWLRPAFQNEALQAALWEGAWKVLAVVAAGMAAYYLMRWLLRGVRSALVRWPARGVVARTLLFLAGLAVDLLPLVAFAAASYVVVPFLQPAAQLRLVMLAVVNAMLLAGLLLAVCRALLQPVEPGLRPLHLSDDRAAYTYLWLRRFIRVTVYGYVALETAVLLGLSPAGHAFLLRLLGLVICVMLVVLILQVRRGVSAWLAGPAPAGEGGTARLHGLRARLAQVWHVGAIAYVAAVFVFWLLRPGAGMEFLLRATLLTFLVLAAAVLLGIGVRRGLRRAFAIGAVQAVIAVAALLLVLRIWGVNSFAVVMADPGRQIAVGLLRIAGILLVALAVWEFGTLALERYLMRHVSKGRVPASRVRTMLPVARHVLGVTLLAVAALTMLAELGVSITPLLAGVSIVGLAVGLGAQALVKDLIAGFSLLMEDALAVGDVVRIGANAGVVESLTIRTIRLRDVNGTVHNIPLGTVGIVENMTKDFAYAVIDAGVAYRENVDEVIGVLGEIAEGLRADPAYAASILEPLDMIGLDRLGESAITIRCRLKTLPGQQWRVMREFNRRMKAAFDARGIEIPFPYRTIVLGQDKAGHTPALRVEPAQGRPDGAPPSSAAPQE